MDSPEPELDGATQPTIYVKVEPRPEKRTAATAAEEEEGVTLKLLCPDAHVITLAFPLSTTLRVLSERVSRLVELPVDTLHFSSPPAPSPAQSAERCRLVGAMTLEQLGGRANDTLTLSLSSSHPLMLPIRIKHTTLPPLPDVITVRLRHSKFFPFFFFFFFLGF